MHLVTEETQHVRVAALGLDLWLAPGETIWTESSYKFLPGELPRMGGASGFASVVEWTDALWPFSLSLLVALHEVGRLAAGVRLGDVSRERAIRSPRPTQAVARRPDSALEK